uniref:AGRL2-4 GAIN subdomain A domain-containing protein n=1 Tax=Bubo bubo TaxID=30461 RepID=A0A8C0FH32_BUBBB
GGVTTCLVPAVGAGVPQPTEPCRENLLRVGSALLDTSNKRHWELIQQTEGGTAWLLKHFEDYASALAQNMPQTYLSPFTIVTPNIGEQGPPGTGTRVCSRRGALGTCLWVCLGTYTSP